MKTFLVSMVVGCCVLLAIGSETKKTEMAEDKNCVKMRTMSGETHAFGDCATGSTTLEWYAAKANTPLFHVTPDHKVQLWRNDTSRAIPVQCAWESADALAEMLAIIDPPRVNTVLTYIDNRTRAETLRAQADAAEEADRQIANARAVLARCK